MAETKNKNNKRVDELKKALESGGRVLPNNFEAEQAVLGCALIDSEICLNIIGRLEEADFYNETHKNIFKAIRDLQKDSINVDFVSVSDYLENKGLINSAGGISYITSLTNIVPSAAGYSHYVEIVKRDSVLRQLIITCGDAITKAYDKDADETILGVAEKALYEIAEKGQRGTLENIEVPLQNVINKIETIYKDPNSLKGLKTGFYQIDKVTNGLQNSDLIILAARPGVGKTSLAMNIVTNTAIERGAKCAVFSLEMGRDQLVQRMLFSVAGVSMAKALRGEINENDWVKIWKAEKKLKNTEIYIDDNAMNTPAQVLSKCRKIKREKGLDLVVIDYLGLMKSDEKTDNRQNEVASISRQMKILAKELNVPVITLCQLNRSVESRDTKDGKPAKPMLSDLRESGSIEQDADMVWFIHRDMTAKEIAEDRTGNYTAELIIAKFRNGQPGSVYIGWDGSRTSFYNLEKDANEQSLVNQYEKNEEAKQTKKNKEKSFAETAGSIVNEIDIEQDLVGLEPPPEIAEEPPVMDFSDVQIPTDDEIF